MVNEDATHSAGTLHEKDPPSPARWSSKPQGRLISIDWGRYLNSNKHVDPYLVWADISRFSGMGGWPPKDNTESQGTWPILVELEHESSLDLPGTAKKPAPNACELMTALAAMQIPGLYKENPGKLRARFFTARISPDSVEQLLLCSDIKRFQLGLPRINGTDTKPRLMDKPQGGARQRVVVGIIDDGCAFAHPAFCDDQGNTRVHYLWDQDAARTPACDPRGALYGWTAVPEAGYGAELGHPELNAASKKAWKAGWDEMAYASVNYGPLRLEPGAHGTMFEQGAQIRPMQAMRRSAHGASVMFLAAGVDERRRIEQEGQTIGFEYMTPLGNQRAAAGSSPKPVRATEVGDARDQCDHATQWPIIFVQLPTRSILDTSGGSLGVHVLDGLEYIVQRTEQLPLDFQQGYIDAGSRNPSMADDPKRRGAGHRLVVTISYGAVAGPHDGTSIIERAIAALVERRQFTWVCLAAGNAHRTRTHARIALTAGQEKSFLWRIGADNPLQSFLEIWLPDSRALGDGALAEQHLRQISFTVRPPGVHPLQRVHCGELHSCEVRNAQGQSQVVAGVIYSAHVAQGLRGTMLLLAVAATQADGLGQRPLPPHGDWIVDVHYGRPGVGEPGQLPEIVVHAWAERNDLLYGNLRAQQSTLSSSDPIPEPTEFMPEARRRMEMGRGFWGNQHLPDELQPTPSLGSLSGLKPTTGSSSFMAATNNQYGHVVIAGATRLSDGEVSAYSSGGPNRHAEPRFGNRGLGPHSKANYETLREYDPKEGRPLQPVDRPDVSAPADVSPALPGLRVAGLRAGSQARISGTSAAAPSVARRIANLQYLASGFDLSDPKDWTQFFGVVPGGIPRRDEAMRPTPTPAKDDEFRRGTWEIK